MAETNIELARQSLDAFVESQLTLTRPFPPVDLGKSVIGIFDGHKDRRMPAMVATRRLDFGTSRMKFFRRVTLHGDGECRLSVIVDGVVVVSGVPVTMAEGPTSPATVGLPRGTAGKWVLVEIVGQSLPDSLDIDWDLIA